ncbi:MAG: recombination regulator RecX [Achromobacter pulmonis]|uniref:recombination regulator RecX n=1 Tax=Achromobacter pulmonis TaxID=1389932 RepID=UPI0012BEC38C|nr:recombination regulator RecX [Achromobacter pulmonis]MCF7766116.1 recombination regulator RecX [Achromobacter pulmonis]MPT25846.1 recombination regulator RecX [Achromobacter sp.]CAB3635270.1 Regulatory protein RecX [Achromobacter pulmonis]
MSWKPPVTSADRLRARLDDEFETVAKPEGLRRTSDLRRAADSTAAADQEPAAGQSRTPRKGPSLKMRAVGYLSRREHARDELARKLAPHAEDPDEVGRVLDALEKEGWLSTERFAQSLVHRRASRQGAARIVRELRQHGVDDAQVSELREQLRATEYERALEVWQKRFGAKPEDRAAYAKQARFLASRGFAHDVIRRIVGAGDDD